MISHRLPLDRFGEALALAQDSRSGGKVMIEMA